MEEGCKIYDESASVRSRLAELGLTPEVLLDSIEYGVRHKFDCTSFAPRILGGFLIWGKGTEELRMKLGTDGWIPTSTNNLEGIKSPNGEVGIVVSAGDSATGIKENTPTNRNDKGIGTVSFIANNQLHFTDHFTDSDFPRPIRAAPLKTWLLLHQVDDEAEVIRVELSLPVEISASGFVRKWKERIILKSITFNKVISTNDDDEGDSGDLDINVARR